MKTKLATMGLLGAMSLAGLAQPAFADGEEEAGAWGPFSATVAVTSDYRFRGISQSDNEAAIQGSIDFAQDWFFAGVWASNLDFSGFGDPDTSIEVDLYAGATAALSDRVTGTIKAVYYAYPDEDIPGVDYNYWEFIGALDFDLGKAGLGAEIAWSPDFFGEVGDAVALTGTLTVPLWSELWIFDGGIETSAHLGHQWFESSGLVDYLYYDLGVSATAGVFTFDARYVDTDLSAAECGHPDYCDSGFVFTLSVALPG
jgi:uncharacterized protein (TIGR02001 family)